MTDFEDILKYFSDEEVSKFEDFYPMSEKQVRNMIAEWKDMDNRLVAELKVKRKVIGSVGYWIIKMIKMIDNHGRRKKVCSYYRHLSHNQVRFQQQQPLHKRGGFLRNFLKVG